MAATHTHRINATDAATVAIGVVCMSDSPTTPTIDPTTDAWSDYVAVIVNGDKPSVRATERGITPSTVSANVARIKRAIDAGATVPDGTDAPVSVPTFDAWLRDTHTDDVADAVSVFGSAIDDVMRDRARAVAARDDAERRINAADARMGTVAAMFDRATPKNTPALDTLRTDYDAYAASYTPPTDGDNADGDNADAPSA